MGRVGIGGEGYFVGWGPQSERKPKKPTEQREGGFAGGMVRVPRHPPKKGSPENGTGRYRWRRLFCGVGPKSKRISKKPTEQSVVGFTDSSLLLGCGGCTGTRTQDQ